MSGLQESRAATYRRQHGAALVIVLWLIVLLAVIAAGHNNGARLETRLTARQMETAESRYVAEAATELAIARLLLPATGQSLAVDGRLVAMNIGARNAFVSVRRANGLVDINAASEALLATLFAAAGAQAQDAEALAARVIDWRDADSFKHLNGAEDEDYRSAGLGWTARDGRFASVEELRYVLGMSQAIFRKLRPYLTVHSGTGGIDFNVAPEFLLDVFDSAATSPPRRAPNSELLPGVRGGNGTFHINVAVPGSDGVLVSSETVVRVARNAEPQFTVLSWRDVSRLLTLAPEVPRI